MPISEAFQVSTVWKTQTLKSYESFPAYWRMFIPCIGEFSHFCFTAQLPDKSQWHWSYVMSVLSYGIQIIIIHKSSEKKQQSIELIRFELQHKTQRKREQAAIYEKGSVSEASCCSRHFSQALKRPSQSKLLWSSQPRSSPSSPRPHFGSSALRPRACQFVVSH